MKNFKLTEQLEAVSDLVQYVDAENMEKELEDLWFGFVSSEWASEIGAKRRGDCYTTMQVLKKAMKTIVG